MSCFAGISVSSRAVDRRERHRSALQHLKLALHEAEVEVVRTAFCSEHALGVNRGTSWFVLASVRVDWLIDVATQVARQLDVRFRRPQANIAARRSSCLA
jgi:hypothetical protein